ncbi:MAG: hypothetical protein PF638_05565 [Candidatus Delongbacteria bacterium]|jgi:hypothetical protein|nr:hypothetical protein [Candidatus Delongbacteria bacterium]
MNNENKKEVCYKCGCESSEIEYRHVHIEMKPENELLYGAMQWVCKECYEVYNDDWENKSKQKKEV